MHPDVIPEKKMHLSLGGFYDVCTATNGAGAAGKCPHGSGRSGRHHQRLGGAAGWAYHRRAVVFDPAMGHLARFYCDHMTPTVSLSISYLRPVPVDQPLFVRVHMDKPGSTVDYITAELYTAGAPEKILATASGVYLSLSKE